MEATGSRMLMRHIRPLLGKEFLDLARNKTTLVPVAIVTVLSLALPFGIAIAIPAMTGHALGEDADLVRVSHIASAAASLSDDGRIQLFLFQQFLMMFLITPVTGAMALASHAIVGEKQARTLEPLLATPLGTFELLTAKVVGALIPTFAISAVGLIAYGFIVAGSAEPGVAPAMLGARTLVLVLGVG